MNVKIMKMANAPLARAPTKSRTLFEPSKNPAVDGGYRRHAFPLAWLGIYTI